MTFRDGDAPDSERNFVACAKSMRRRRSGKAESTRVSSVACQDRCVGRCHWALTRRCRQDRASSRRFGVHQSRDPFQWLVPAVMFPWQRFERERRKYSSVDDIGF